MNGSETAGTISPGQLVQFLYSAVERPDIESFTRLVWADALWQTATASGRGGAELFTVLLDLVKEGGAKVCQLVAQHTAVIALGPLVRSRDAEAGCGEFAHVWQLAVIYEAVTTAEPRLRWLVGDDAVRIAAGRAAMSDEALVALWRELPEAEYWARFNALLGMDVPVPVSLA